MIALDMDSIAERKTALWNNAYNALLDVRRGLPVRMREMVESDGLFLTGGSIPCAINNEPINDYDMYFRNQLTAMKFSAALGEFRKTSEGFAMIAVFEKYPDDDDETGPDLEPEQLVTPNAVTFKNKLQLIFNPAFCADPVTTVNRFDFTIVQSYIEMRSGKLYTKRSILDDIVNRRLRLSTSAKERIVADDRFRMRTESRQSKWERRNYSLEGVDSGT